MTPSFCGLHGETPKAGKFGANLTTFHLTVFVLLGLPGLENYHTWLSIPFCLIYITAVLGNRALILVVLNECTLHEPMYVFLSMLAGTDILLSTTAVPTALAIFWFHAGEIAFDACITHFAFVTESGVLLATACDCYMAINTPLRYTAILTPQFSSVAQLCLTLCKPMDCSTSGFPVHHQLPELAQTHFHRVSDAIQPSHLNSYSNHKNDPGNLGTEPWGHFPYHILAEEAAILLNNVIPHSYCELTGVARLAFAGITVNIGYGFSVPMASVLVDVALIGISYTLILQAMFRLPSQDAWHKAVNTCGSHSGFILLFFIPSIFTFLTYHFGKNIPPAHNIHFLLANLYVLIPPMLNPIIYGAKTKKIRDCVAYMLSIVGKS